MTFLRFSVVFDKGRYLVFEPENVDFSPLVNYCAPITRRQESVSKAAYYALVIHKQGLNA